MEFMPVRAPLFKTSDGVFVNLMGLGMEDADGNVQPESPWHNRPGSIICVHAGALGGFTCMTCSAFLAPWHGISRRAGYANRTLSGCPFPKRSTRSPGETSLCSRHKMTSKPSGLYARHPRATSRHLPWLSTCPARPGHGSHTTSCPWT